MTESMSCQNMCQNGEKCMCLWRGNERVSFTFEDPLNGCIKKLSNVKEHIFLATSTFDLYHGTVLCETNPSSDTILFSITFKRAQFYAVDIDANSEYLFIVNADGHVLKINPQDLNIVQTIILKDDIKFCCHGYEQDNEISKIKTIAVNDDSALFATENGQLWASGNHPELEINSVEPKKVIFFEGRVVFDLACGFNFHAVIVRKINRTLKEDTDSENELDDQVFVKSCPQCLNNAMISPVSVASSDTYPMGHHVQNFSDRSSNSLSAISSASKDDVLICSVSENLSNYHEPLVNGISESEKKNVMFINTEAAKQFLTRQLSWVSSYGSGKDEIYIDGADNPTNLLKQNVSNMANLVYEGVKTVGDKVATLSRHVSGSSDVNDQENEKDLAKIEENKRTQSSLIHSLRCEEFPWSSSAGSSEHELSQQGLNERINLLVREGNNLLSTELWTWGDVKHGQLGTGDTVKRPRPVLVTKLSQTGVKKISCGSFHTVAITLDGRVFTWGRNNCKQTANEWNSCQSAPLMFTTSRVSKLSNYPSNERAKDMSAGTEHTFILMQPALLLFLGRFHYSYDGVNKIDSSSELCGVYDASNVEDFSWNSLSRILCSGPFSCCTTTSPSANEISEDFINEQIFLEELISFYQHLIRPFQKKGAAANESNVYETLCRCYTELMNITALNVQSLSDYYNNMGKTYEVTIIANVDECVAIYKYYLNAICDVISLSGFTHIARIIELPQAMPKKLHDLKALGTRKINNENVIATSLQNPLFGLNRYKTMINNLIKCNGSKMGIERLKEALSKWERIIDEQEKRQREAEITKQFWEGSGKLIELLRSPERRLIRESRTHPISVLNSGRFTTHWFVLLTDIFIHITGSSHVSYPLPTLWVEPLQDSDTLQNALSVTTPESNITLYAPTAVAKNEWMQSLHAAINCSLPRVVGHKPPMARNSTFTFTKHPVYKDAKYTGRWFNGKPDTDESYGQMDWPDGRMYKGQFSKGVINGYGTMHNLTQGIYKGQWKDGQQNGYGTMKYMNGDVYEGYFKDGSPHGHGTKKEGHFMASAASVYIGEWVSGVKQGYGIMDDIITGEKYIGSWSNNMKHGCGLIVTLDGIYYEGVFVQDVLTGYGVMVFEDGTHYEGEFKSAGIFCGKGTLTFFSGDKLEGNLSGAWNEGIKVNATLHIKKANDNSHNTPKPTCFGKLFTPPELPKSFGKLCVPPDQKWKAIFRHCYQQLDVPEPGNKSAVKFNETQKLWDNVAVIISNSYHKKLKFSKTTKDSMKNEVAIDTLSKIPDFGRDKLNLTIYDEIHQYLSIAFESSHHPLGKLLTELTTVYTATYGGVRVHPLLKTHAVNELRSLTTRIYEIITLFFPAMPENGGECLSVIEKLEDVKEMSSDETNKGELSKPQELEERKVRIDAAILHPVLLPRVHSALFFLYALDNKKDDDAYWKRLIKWNKQPDSTLTSFLGIDQIFGESNSVEQDSKEPLFSKAIETLQQLKTTFTPLEKLKVVHNTVKQVEQVAKAKMGSSYNLIMDDLFPAFIYVVVRASVLQLGSEINFITDFIQDSRLENGKFDFAFTTLTGSYHYILHEKMTNE
ncbi:alsin [Leptopilina heterotoma]|uniref:alsin n=1 Tax=Leptopilina heterotoma TaxID=63436 RepID=UPI001CA89351|nr:alsin [Leptopilina heterotoma]